MLHVLLLRLLGLIETILPHDLRELIVVIALNYGQFNALIVNLLLACLTSLTLGTCQLLCQLVVADHERLHLHGLLQMLSLIELHVVTQCLHIFLLQGLLDFSATACMRCQLQVGHLLRKLNELIAQLLQIVASGL